MFASQLLPYAKKYIWWKTPDEAVAVPERVIAQVMNIGDYSDVQALVKLIGEDKMVDVLNHAEAGQFTERSWSYWHYRLGLSTGYIPSLPIREFSSKLKNQPDLELRP